MSVADDESVSSPPTSDGSLLLPPVRLDKTFLQAHIHAFCQRQTNRECVSVPSSSCSMNDAKTLPPRELHCVSRFDTFPKRTKSMCRTRTPMYFVLFRDPKMKGSRPRPKQTLGDPRFPRLAVHSEYHAQLYTGDRLPRSIPSPTRCPQNSREGKSSCRRRRPSCAACGCYATPTVACCTPKDT